MIAIGIQEDELFGDFTLFSLVLKIIAGMGIVITILAYLHQKEIQLRYA